MLAFLTALTFQQPAAAPLFLEVRAFTGTEEVTSQLRLTVHHAGERGEPFKSLKSADGRIELEVPAGIYDIQAIQERDERVVNIRWANRLVVMPYPDEEGRHLEVVNFKNGYGALQVRGADRASVKLYEAGRRDKPIASAFPGRSYVLFIVPSGLYDMQITVAAKSQWKTGIDVPLDRTRLWVVQ